MRTGLPSSEVAEQLARVLQAQLAGAAEHLRAVDGWRCDRPPCRPAFAAPLSGVTPATRTPACASGASTTPITGLCTMRRSNTCTPGVPSTPSLACSSATRLAARCRSACAASSCAWVGASAVRSLGLRLFRRRRPRRARARCRRRAAAWTREELHGSSMGSGVTVIMDACGGEGASQPRVSRRARARRRSARPATASQRRVDSKLDRRAQRVHALAPQRKLARRGRGRVGISAASMSREFASRGRRRLRPPRRWTPRSSRAMREQGFELRGFGVSCFERFDRASPVASSSSGDRPLAAPRLRSPSATRAAARSPRARAPRRSPAAPATACACASQARAMIRPSCIGVRAFERQCGEGFVPAVRRTAGGVVVASGMGRPP